MDYIYLYYNLLGLFSFFIFLIWRCFYADIFTAKRKADDLLALLWHSSPRRGNLSLKMPFFYLFCYYYYYFSLFSFFKLIFLWLQSQNAQNLKGHEQCKNSVWLARASLTLTVKCYSLNFNFNLLFFRIVLKYNKISQAVLKFYCLIVIDCNRTAINFCHVNIIVIFFLYL